MNSMTLYMLIIGFVTGGLAGAIILLLKRPRETPDEILLKKLEILEGVQER